MTPLPQSDLVSGRFIALYPSLAQKLGLNEAIVVQELHFLLSIGGGKEINGEHWVYNTYEQWQEHHFPWWTTRTIRRIFSQLETMLIVQSCQPDGVMSRKKYYRLNTGVWVKLIKGTLPFPDVAKLSTSTSPECPHPKQNTLNRKTKEPKETPTKVGEIVPAVWKPDNRSKEEKLSTLKAPLDYPSERDFNDFVEEHCPLCFNCRPLLYGDLCARKWRQWNEGARKWIPVRDWRGYVMSLEQAIIDAIPG